MQTLLIGILILGFTGCSTTQPVVLSTQAITPTDTSALMDAPSTPDLHEPTRSPTLQPTTGEAKTTAANTPTETLPAPVFSETVILTEASPSPSSTAKPKPTLAPDEWKRLPVIPTVSNTVVQIYHRGQEMGNNPRAFAKIGDCGSTPAWFLGDFDRGPNFYSLGDYHDLTEVIQEFQGSFDRTSLAAKSGFNASSLFVALWADRSQCQANETPLACEYRIHRPVIAFIMLGTNDIYHPDEFEPQMRKIIEFSIENGVVPILSTKADNEEGDGSINAIIARLAMEYDIPLWNFWLAVQPLPDQGLQEDKVHLTWGRNLFDDSDTMSKAWPVRNLTALQVLNAVWRKVTEQSE